MASSTTRARRVASWRKSSRMNGRVLAWFSHTARPQNRQVATAVRRQCQQSMPHRGIPLLVIEAAVDGYVGVEVAAAERVGDGGGEAISVELKRPKRGHGSNRGVARKRR